MSNNNTLPVDIQQEIYDGATVFITHNCYKHEEEIAREAFTVAATEYAPYKVKYEQAERLLDKFMARHEAGLLPDVFIYNEIKTFLDGTK